MSKDLMSEVCASVNRTSIAFDTALAASKPAQASRDMSRADSISGRSAPNAGMSLTWATWSALAWAHAQHGVDNDEERARYAADFDAHVKQAVMLGGDRALPKHLQAKGALIFARKAAKAHREKHWVPRNKDAVPQV